MLPEAFLERMQQMLGEEYEAFLESFEHEKYHALRLNALKVGADGRSAAEVFGKKFSCADALAESECESLGDGTEEVANGRADFAHLSPVPWAENGYYYETSDQPGKHPYHDAGLYYIQEPSAMAPVELLGVEPGERVLDLCAAPGGKSTQIAAKLKRKGFLLCNEIHPARAKILSENVERMGICNACVTNETPAHLAEIFPEYFDKILVDAPCSGEGMFRKNEAACEEWSPENVALCAERQDEILDCAARMLRPGGRLVYSTCTFAPAENEGSIRRFLQRHGEFEIVAIDKAALGLEGGDGRPEWAWLEGGESAGSVPESGDGQESGRIQGMEADQGINTDTEKGTGINETLRLWPHRIKGEGHYAAVLQKKGEFPEGFHRNAMNGVAKAVSEKELEAFIEFAQDTMRMGTDDLSSTERHKAKNGGTGGAKGTKIEASILPALGALLGLEGSLQYITFGDNLYLVSVEMPSVKGLKVLRPGLHLGELKKNRFEPSHALALALEPGNVKHMWNLDSREGVATAYLNGQTFPAEGEKGWYLICVDGFSIGWGKLAGGIMKNHYPKGLRR